MFALVQSNIHPPQGTSFPQINPRDSEPVRLTLDSVHLMCIESSLNLRSKNHRNKVLVEGRGDLKSTTVLSVSYLISPRSQERPGGEGRTWKLPLHDSSESSLDAVPKPGPKPSQTRPNLRGVCTTSNRYTWFRLLEGANVVSFIANYLHLHPLLYKKTFTSSFVIRIVAFIT